VSEHEPSRATVTRSRAILASAFGFTLTLAAYIIAFGVWVAGMMLVSLSTEYGAYEASRPLYDTLWFVTILGMVAASLGGGAWAYRRVGRRNVESIIARRILNGAIVAGAAGFGWLCGLWLGLPGALFLPSGSVTEAALARTWLVVGGAVGLVAAAAAAVALARGTRAG